MKFSQIINTYLRYVIWIAAALLALRFYIVLHDLNMVITDNDQLLTWYACYHLSNGIFYTPFIYGCDYGSSLEALAAVPFYKLGLPLYIAIPSSNAIWIGLFSVLIGWNLNRRYTDRQAGTVFIILLALLPTSFYAILFAAKGHAAGILMILSGIALVTGFKAHWVWIIAGILAGLGFQFNPNSVFLLFSFALFWNDKKSLWLLFAGLLLSLLYQIPAAHYRDIVASEQLHRQWSIQYSLADLKTNLFNMDKHLNAVTPIFHNRGFISALLPLLPAIAFFVRREWLKGTATVGLSIAIFLSFGVNKLSDGSNDILFPYARFYLALAFVSAIMVAMFFAQIQPKKMILILPALAPVLIIFQIQKTSAEARNLALIAGNDTWAVRKIRITDLMINYNWILKKLKETKENRNQIVLNDAVFYSENMYLSTAHQNGVTSYFQNYRAFYWMNNAIQKDTAGADFLILVGYDKTLARKIKEYPQFYHPDSLIPYFLVKNVKNKGEFIDRFLE